jgi:hypothetical protein
MNRNRNDELTWNKQLETPRQAYDTLNNNKNERRMPFGMLIAHAGAIS